MNTVEQPLTTPLVPTDGSGSAANFGIRRQAFRALHAAGCFVIPNPWDVGSARYLQHLGFPALATTSAGFAFSQGLPDSEPSLSRDRDLTHIAEITAAVDVPVNADFASGYGKAPEDVDLWLWTQVNRSTIEVVMDRLGQPMGRAHTVMEKWGYTGSACLPMAMDDAARSGRLNPGDLVLLTGSGAGLSMGCVALTWNPRGSGR